MVQIRSNRAAGGCRRKVAISGAVCLASAARFARRSIRSERSRGGLKSGLVLAGLLYLRYSADWPVLVVDVAALGQSTYCARHDEPCGLCAWSPGNSARGGPANRSTGRRGQRHTRTRPRQNTAQIEEPRQNQPRVSIRRGSSPSE